MEGLHGLGIANYRSFGEHLQLVGPLSKVNLLAGQNNSGKSNILRFVRQFVTSNPPTPTALDRPIGSPEAHRLTLSIAVLLPEERIQEMAGQDRHAFLVLDSIFNNPAVRLTNADLAWIRFTLDPGKDVGRWSLDSTLVEEVIDQLDSSVAGQIGQVTLNLRGQSSGGTTANLRLLLELLNPFEDLPPIQVIEAFRQIRPSPQQEPSVMYNGSGLVEGLQRLERPSIERQEDKTRFAAINRFLQVVLDDESAQLEVPHDAKTILVSRSGVTLPLEHLGTGIHQVVILASAATLLENHVVCMEEPEVHLHPILQRKLLRYLVAQTTNQYLIATHSAHMLDNERAGVYHVQHTAAGTQIRRAGTPKELASICADLGYRPSDLLQANAVLWVEGPSDRIYLRHWIGLCDPSLIEGIHFSIMFYGGRLLNHLSALDPELEEFISLRRLNRHIAILIDSDKRTSHARLNKTKTRVRDEFEKGDQPGFAWVTDGRTIENYIPQPVLAAAIEELQSGTKLKYKGDKWADPLEVRPQRTIDKVKLAHVVVSQLSLADLNHRDLTKRMEQLVAFVRSANGLTD